MMKTKKNTQKELFGMLQNLSTVVSTRWSMVCTIVDNMDKITILEKKWEDWQHKNDNPEYYPLDLSKIETWSTYDNSNCISLKFSINENKNLTCDAKIFHGDNFSGHAKDCKFSAKLLMPNKFILELNDLISYKFDDFLEDQYEKHLKSQKRDWMNNLKLEFMNHFNNKKVDNL